MTSATSILDRARSYVARMDAAVSGQNGHAATFSVARVLVTGFALSEGDALRVMLEFNSKCVPPWSERELHHKIRSAINTPSDKPRGYLLGHSCPPARPSAPRRTPAPIDPATATEIYLAGFLADEADVWEASPIRPPEDWRTAGALLVSWLYRPEERINIVTDFHESDGKARPVGHGVTLERDAMVARLDTGPLESKAGAWLRMNPIDARGIGDANVTAFRFALLECDSVPVDLQLSLFCKLPLPVAAILTSGGRSLHAWVRVDAPDASTYAALVSKMLSMLARFGVDGKNKNPSRLSRLPGVTRTIGADGNAAQRLLYLNPDAREMRRILT